MKGRNAKCVALLRTPHFALCISDADYTPIKPVLQLLKTKKYDIPANIEYEYKGQDTVAEVKRCFEYAKAASA